jgi:hypothetical protein
MLSNDLAGLLALGSANSAEKGQVDTLNTQLTGLMGQLGNRSTDLQSEMDKQGVGTAYGQMKELGLRAAQLQGEIQQFDAQTGQISNDINQQAIPTGLLQGQQLQLQTQRDLTRNSKTAELASTTALQQAYQGNATLGTTLAQQAVDLKYAPMENQISVLQTQLGIAKENMTAADKKRADVINAIAEEQKTRTADAKKLESDISTLAIEAASNGAPLSVVNAMKAAKDPATAASIAHQYLAGSQYVKPSKASTKGTITDGTMMGDSANYSNVSRTKDAGGGYAFFGKNKTTGKMEPIGIAVYALKKGIPLDQVLTESKNLSDKALIAEIKAARAEGNTDEEILKDMYDSGNFKHFFVGIGGTTPGTTPKPTTNTPNPTPAKPKKKGLFGWGFLGL